jgi:hypothetical protein
VSNRSAFPTVQTSEDNRTRVSDLRRQIESKEAELIRKKEALAQNDATGVAAAQIELNRLQSAFEQVPKLADSKLRPADASAERKPQVTNEDIPPGCERA